MTDIPGPSDGQEILFFHGNRRLIAVLTSSLSIYLASLSMSSHFGIFFCEDFHPNVGTYFPPTPYTLHVLAFHS